MGNSQTLLSRTEAIKFLRMPEFPRCSLQSIFAMEYYLLVDHIPFFGETLYEALLADLIDTSAISSFSSVATYATGDRVKYNGTFYQSLSDANGSEPSDASNWAIMDKFETACYNELWCDFGLGEYLSRQLFLDSYAETVVSVTGSGVGVKTNPDMMPAKEYELALIRSSHQSKSNRCLYLMHKYISNNHEDPSDCFYGLIDDTDGCDCTIDEYGRVVKRKSPLAGMGRIGSWSII